MNAPTPGKRWKQKHVTRARRLRRNLTDAERRLWRHLRRGQLGTGFRRQHPIGKYILDFVCLEFGIVVELDGGQHSEERFRYDAGRTTWLEARGFQVIRFWNNEVLNNVEGVVTEVSRILQHAREAGAPLPDPPPQAGEGDMR